MYDSNESDVCKVDDDYLAITYENKFIKLSTVS